MGRSTILRALLAVVLVFLAIAWPGDLRRPLAWPAPSVPVEGLVLFGLLLLLPERFARFVRGLAVLLLGLFLLLKIGDFGTLSAFSRPFNPVLDLHLLSSGWMLLSGTVGVWQAALYVISAILAWMVAMWVMAFALAGLPRLPRLVRRAGGALCLLLAAAALIAPAAVPADRSASIFILARAEAMGEAMREFSRFEAALMDDPAETIPPDTRLAALRGHDVLIAFVESYGRSALAAPLYAPTVLGRLESFQRQASGAGFAARSGWLTAPTVGGQSWLAHGTLLSGLWVDGQQRYDRLVTSERPSLNRLFAEAGWRTVGVMPAITMDWPEGRWYGYDATYASSDLGYRGAPFNWVTMPDQYTLSALNRLEFDRPGRPPVMAEVALISSHAPWTPIPPLLPWEAIGDGSVFDPYARAGDPPEVVWRDPDRVRAQYLLSIDYALEVLASYVEGQSPDDLVIVILGDHQPAPIVTGEGASRDVPVHILSRDARVLERLNGWGWSEGMIPAADAPVWPMDAFRERFLRAFSDAG